MTPCLLFISCLAHVRRNRTFIFNHSVVTVVSVKTLLYTLQRHTTSKHVFKFTCVTTLVVWVSDCCWNSDDRHSVLCLNASCVNPDRQTAGRPATDQNRLCYTLWHERTAEEKTLWSGSTGALRDKQRNVYSGLFSNSDPTRFLFLKVFFFLPEYSGECFFTSETLFNFSSSVELTRKMCETEWKTFTWKTFFGTQCVKNKYYSLIQKVSGRVIKNV